MYTKGTAINMTIMQLRYMIAISETGSLSRASEVLFVSQPSLTSSVKELERELGINIFNRGGKGMTLTADGAEFILYARQVCQMFDNLLDKYEKPGTLKKKFGVSAQHYSFAVKAFVEMTRNFDISEYDFALRETKTSEVIADVSSLKSEIGILYLSDFNRKILSKLFAASDIEFHSLIECKAYVYLWSGHPLADNKSVTMHELEKYPCLSFDQGENGSFYLAEELYSTREYQRAVKVSDRATMLNLMLGLGGYTISSGIICEELNGDDYVAVPLEPEEPELRNKMDIGYIKKKDMILSRMGELYISEIEKYLSPYIMKN